MKIRGWLIPFSGATAARLTLWAALLVMAAIMGLAFMSGGPA